MFKLKLADFRNGEDCPEFNQCILMSQFGKVWKHNAESLFVKGFLVFVIMKPRVLLYLLILVWYHWQRDPPSCCSQNYYLMLFDNRNFDPKCFQKIIRPVKFLKSVSKYSLGYYLIVGIIKALYLIICFYPVSYIIHCLLSLILTWIVNSVSF